MSAEADAPVAGRPSTLDRSSPLWIGAAMTLGALVVLLVADAVARRARVIEAPAERAEVLA